MDISERDSYYDKDISIDFINNEYACIGYDKANASSLYEILRRIKKEDIKSYNFSNNTLIIKAIEDVIGRSIKEFKFPNITNSMGYGIKIFWKNFYVK